jgi:hypothetical protein
VSTLVQVEAEEVAAGAAELEEEAVLEAATTELEARTARELVGVMTGAFWTTRVLELPWETAKDSVTGALEAAVGAEAIVEETITVEEGTAVKVELAEPAAQLFLFLILILSDLLLLPWDLFLSTSTGLPSVGLKAVSKEGEWKGL